jgi:2-polyprenyl-6-methoxyphenol hydroxylase-like FAD-dependent oxidoreductase
VTGDAIASFNPVYGQGMSVAALEALELHHALADGLGGVGPRFFERASDVVDTAWSLAVGADAQFAETTAPVSRARADGRQSRTYSRQADAAGSGRGDG